MRRLMNVADRMRSLRVWTEPSGRALSAALLSLAVAGGTASPGQAQVGFQTIAVASGGSAIPVAVWYPTKASGAEQPLGLFRQTVASNAPVAGDGLHLIVISHGNGGTKDGHYDTALALARAGFVVAALEHTGDNYRDQSHATDLANRPRELHRLIDYMLLEWPNRASLNSSAVGGFGFSSGGFTVLSAAGGDPDLTLFAAHCSAHPAEYDCRLVSTNGAAAAFGAQAMVHDHRLRALVVAAPALGFTFAHGLASVTQPVQLWKADDDHVLPPPDYADAVFKALPTPPEFHSVPKADHFDFLAPCSAALAQVAPAICQSEAGFDRAAFHSTFNRDVVAFFRRTLN